VVHFEGSRRIDGGAAFCHQNAGRPLVRFTGLQGIALDIARVALASTHRLHVVFPASRFDREALANVEVSRTPTFVDVKRSPHGLSCLFRDTPKERAAAVLFSGRNREFKTSAPSLWFFPLQRFQLAAAA
jgi:hypothetical protein